jgi:hypothetical protein
VRSDGQPLSWGLSRTTSHTSAAMAAVARPTAAKLPRQPRLSLSQARGELAPNAPKPPVAMNSPPITTKRRGLNHSASSLKLHTNTVETPTPTSTRPATARPRLGA